MAETEINEKYCLEEIKSWIKSEAEFYGRTDEDFLLMFLRACNFDCGNTKKKITKYYENRRDVPQWLGAHRNVMDSKIHSTLLKKSTTALIETGQDKKPTIFLTILSRMVGDDDVDDYMLASSICVEAIVRRQNCQLNGGIWIMDCKDYKWWMPLRFSVPSTVKNFINAFLLTAPFKQQLIVALNTPQIVLAFFKIVKSLMPQYLQNIFRFYGSDWSGLNAYMPIEWLPDEYGGNAGPLQIHDDAFLQELIEFNNYFIDDSKYGFKNGKKST